MVSSGGGRERTRGQEDDLLFNELTVTRSAGVRTSALVRPRPSLSFRPFARLRLRTEEGQPEIYLLLREQTASDGEAWIDLRLSGRPNGRTGWVPAAALRHRLKECLSRCR
jgi:hypothetical protein